MGQIQCVPIIVVLIATLVSATTDVWRYKVHNVLTLPLLLGGLIYHGVVGGWAGFGASGLGALFGFGVLLGFYIIGGMGPGDVKLMAGVGAWLGLPLTFYVFIASSLAAGLYAVALLIVGRNLGETWTNFQILWIRVAILGRHLGSGNQVEQEVLRTDRRRRLIPFAAMVAIGLITILLLWHNGGLPRQIGS